MKHQVVVCDDEPLEAQSISIMLKRAIMIQDEVVQSKLAFLGSYFSYATTLQAVQEHKVREGIYFLDIDLADPQGKDGLDLAEEIKQSDPNAQIIFVTTHAELALLTFKRRIGALDFIVKTSDQAKFQARVTETLALALDAFTQKHTARKYTFSYQIGHQIYSENIDDIICIVTTERPHRLQIHKVDGIAEISGSLKELAQRISYSHLRKISQSCIVNAKNIKLIDLPARKIVFINGEIEYFPRRSYNQVKRLITDFEITNAHK